MDETLKALQTWFTGHVDGDWEHEFGIQIETLDNPGWALTVDLAGTELENCQFTPLEIDRGGTDWMQCRVENAQFRGWGGPLSLIELLNAFLTWSGTVATAR